MRRQSKRTAMISGYARMWPRAVFYTKALNQETGRDRNLGRELEFLQHGGIYVLYRDDNPYYVGKANKPRKRLHMWATRPSSPHFHLWNYFSAFAITLSEARLLSQHDTKPKSLRGMPATPKQKLYCYVDETGQDATASLFVVVAVVTAGELDKLRETLIEIEGAAGTGHRKWHKSRPERRLAIPLPGEISQHDLENIIADMASLAVKWHKPLSTRLLPVMGKQAGEMTKFSSPYLVNIRIQRIW